MKLLHSQDTKAGAIVQVDKIVTRTWVVWLSIVTPD